MICGRKVSACPPAASGWDIGDRCRAESWFPEDGIEQEELVLRQDQGPAIDAERDAHRTGRQAEGPLLIAIRQVDYRDGVLSRLEKRARRPRRRSASPPGNGRPATERPLRDRPVP